MTHELYKKYRPRKFKQVRGQNAAITVLAKMVEQERVPHTILFTGPSGTGKTTLARILRVALGCADIDFFEVNCSNYNGIQTIRDIERHMSKAPIKGKCRVWYLDECERLTTDAQKAALKMLEDTPSHVYFMLATTDSTKIIKAIKTRATEVNLKPLTNDVMEQLLNYVLRKEEEEITETVMEKIVDVSGGSARQALVLLEQVCVLEDEDEQLEIIVPPKADAQAIEIVRCLMNAKTPWKKVADLLKEVEGEPEGIRRLILSYARTLLLSGNKQTGRAYIIINTFSESFFTSGAAGLAACCYEVLVGADE